MPGKYAKKRKFPLVPVLIGVAVVLLLAVVILLCGGKDQPDPFDPEQTNGATDPVLETTVPPTTVPPTTVPPEPEVFVSTASFTVTGDLLMHRPVFESCWDPEAGDWVFDPIFTFVSPYIQAADYAVANLETTLCGSYEENGIYQYSGNPLFNCPDGIATASLNAGFDMLLTGNNHCYDTRMKGIRRTLKVLDETGLESLGTQHDRETVDYKVIEVNGIKVGMTAYTAETYDGMPGVISINAIRCHPDSVGMVNTFDYGQLNKFYEEIGTQFEAMKAEGAEAIVVYLHWGEEYMLEPTDYQKKIAQQLCDMGVDVIVGGHPHVIEPVDLLTSTEDENHKTLIIYSTGNAVSNQRIHEMRMKTGHTEDGILFSFTLAKYLDGSVEVIETSCVPTWVHMAGNQESYTILPLDVSCQDQWMEMFGVDEATFAACVDSYNRTMELVGAGMEKAQEWFDAMHEEKVEYFSDPSWSEPTEPPTEPTEATEVPSESTGVTAPSETVGETVPTETGSGAPTE